MSNTVAGSRQRDNLPGSDAARNALRKKHQWRRYANEQTVEQNASIEQTDHVSAGCGCQISLLVQFCTILIV